MKSKRKLYTQEQFSDQEAYDEIREEIRQIRDTDLKHVEKEEEIMRIYDEKKKQIKRKKMEIKEATRKEKGDYREKTQKSDLQKQGHDLGEEDEEEGEINEDKHEHDDKMEEDIQQVPSIRNLGEHIRPITLTRNRVCDMLMSRKFEDLVKGCFVRYKSETSTGNSNSYLLAQIIGVVEGSKQYTLNKTTRTRKLLKLQQSSQQVITLSIQMLSNQHPPGALEISAWIRTNRNKIPKQKQLKDKLEQLNNLIYGKISSEEIDRSIYAESVAIAEGLIEPKGQLSKYIYFMEGQLHDIKVGLDQLESKDEEAIREELRKKNSQKQRYEEIIACLKKKKAEIAAERELIRKKQQQKQKNDHKKYSEIYFEDRKKDRINDKVRNRILIMSSHDGATKIRKQIQQAHHQFKPRLQL